MRIGFLGTLGILATGLVVAGCHEKRVVVVHEQRAVVVQQAPVVVEQEPQVIVVEEPPPPVRVEVRPAPPSGMYIWVGGYWHYDNHRWGWIGGRWAVPPEHRREWVAPRYDRDEHDRGVRYAPGHWR